MSSSQINDVILNLKLVIQVVQINNDHIFPGLCLFALAVGSCFVLVCEKSMNSVDVEEILAPLGKCLAASGDAIQAKAAAVVLRLLIIQRMRTPIVMWGSRNVSAQSQLCRFPTQILAVDLSAPAEGPTEILPPYEKRVP